MPSTLTLTLTLTCTKGSETSADVKGPMYSPRVTVGWVLGEGWGLGVRG